MDKSLSAEDVAYQAFEVLLSEVRRGSEHFLCIIYVYEFHNLNKSLEKYENKGKFRTAKILDFVHITIEIGLDDIPQQNFVTKARNDYF